MGRRKADTAKVFWSGRSQAIRLPAKYRLSCREVSIERRGSSLVLEPSTEPVDAMGWPVSFWKLLGQVDASFNVGDRKRPYERTSPLAR
jgi:antitoxin VapB